MNKILKGTPHPIYKDLIGKRVKITIGKFEYFPDVLYFAGTNSIGHEVISTKNNSILHYVKDWSKVKIKRIRKYGSNKNN